MVILTLGYGAAVFIWLSLEDKSVVTVSVLGVGLSLLVGMRVVRQWRSTFRPAVNHRVELTTKPKGLGANVAISLLVTVLNYIVYGGVVGAGGVIGTLMLMLIKTSLHSHAFPDYPLPLMGAMLTRLPAWTLAGALIGAVVGLLRPDRDYASSMSSYSRSSSSSSSSSSGLVDGLEDDDGVEAAS